jgi:carboxyl-terminal processing protease
MRYLSRLWMPFAAFLAVALALGITFVWPRRNGLDFDIDGSPRAQAAHGSQPYDLTELRVLNAVLIHVKDHYVEPERVNPRRMLLSGLNAIQRSVGPVMIDYTDGAPTLTVRVNDQRREFRVDDVRAPWDLSTHFRQIFAFLQQNLAGTEVDLHDIEYAAVNGMLRTLDPHSILLTPEVYADMRMSTRGEFGGLGIVISIRDGQLTIIRPMPGTPASSAGLARGDRVVKINDEATLNLPLNEAVSRLRGAPGSRVSVYVVREGANGWTTPRRFDLVRAVIHIESVESRMLEGGVGYLKIKSFQGNTFEDMQRALAQLRRQGQLRGLVLDLRDNPGGLLDQAVRISDAFLTGGVIVTTSSNDRSQRDVKEAEAPGTEPNYPMVVLINGGSASASEIVAGALKNHDRALIVGQRSFGKGSVQVLYDYEEDGSALKLTIAQYLTPGDVSIQGVGITPDIAIDPMTVDAEDMDLTVDQGYLRESDLRSHLTNESSERAAAQQSAVVLRYYLPKDQRELLREAGPDDAEENLREGEFLTRFSRDLLAQARRPGRAELLADAEAVLSRARQAELDKAIAELQRLGVDWSAGPDQGASPVDVVVSTSAPDNVGTAGEPFELRVRVTNRGTSPLYQLRATTKSDNRLFADRELVFGKLAPGQSREWSTTLGVCETRDERRVCHLPADVPDRADAIRVEFAEAHDHAPPSAEVRTTIRALPRPLFAYGLQVADNGRGNGDGRVQRGEAVTVYLHVKNVGQGASREGQANLGNLSGSGVLLRDGRFTLPALAPGATHDVAFTFEVLSDFELEEAKLEVSLADVALREGVTEKVLVPIAAAPPANQAPQPRAGQVRVRDGAPLRAAPASDAPLLGAVRGGALEIASQATLGAFTRLDLGTGRPAWVAATDLVEAGGGGRFVEDYEHTPPILRVDLGSQLVTRAPEISLRGGATHPGRIADMYVFVGSRKVFFQSNRGTATPREIAFDTRIPLHGGANVITVVVRHDDDVIGRRTFVVRRDGPNGETLEAPRFEYDELGEDDGSLGDE